MLKVKLNWSADCDQQEVIGWLNDCLIDWLQNIHLSGLSSWLTDLVDSLIRKTNKKQHLSHCSLCLCRRATMNWPEKLSLQLLPQNMLSELQTLCRNSRQVAFHFSNTDQDALRNLHKLMGTGFVSPLDTMMYTPVYTVVEIRFSTWVSKFWFYWKTGIRWWALGLWATTCHR